MLVLLLIICIVLLIIIEIFSMYSNFTNKKEFIRIQNIDINNFDLDKNNIKLQTSDTNLEFVLLSCRFASIELFVFGPMLSNLAL